MARIRIASTSGASENTIVFSPAGGHSHNGRNSSLIDSTAYSIYDFSPTFVGTEVNPDRSVRQENNRIAFEDVIKRVVNNSVLAPAGIRLEAGSLNGSLIIANTITANQLAANTITAAEIFANTITADQIAANTITADELSSNIVLINNVIRSNNYNGTIAANGAITVSGNAGWAITSFGSAEFANTSIRGALIANSVSTPGIDLNSNGSISSTNFNVTATGNLTATSANIAGIITSGSGSIGGWTINSSSISAGSTSLYSNGQITNGNFSVSSGGVLSATGASIGGSVTTGALTATGGSIAGWTFTGSQLSSGGTILNSDGTITLGVTSLSALTMKAGSDISMYAASGGVSSTYYYRTGYSGTSWDTKVEQAASGNYVIYGNTYSGVYPPVFILKTFTYSGAEIRSYNNSPATQTLSVTRNHSTAAAYGADLFTLTDMIQFIKRSDQPGQEFYNTPVGGIRATNGSQPPVFYGGSDIRLKKSIGIYNTPLINDIKNINVYDFHSKMNIDNVGSKIIGFLAQEFYPLYDDIVSGHPDEVDEDGDPVYMQIYRENLIPHMFGVIKYLVEKVENLEKSILNV